ncbi:MAG TPA: hypothetical protein VFX02_02725, partial [Gammaproteobacteria bacterium]|nr:hypothetical protein [Gammaproteobacteria bacterium]
MPRKLIIFGNGLGMALNPNHFSLTNALNTIWNLDWILSGEQKELICRCTGGRAAPVGENELDVLHLAVTSCEILRSMGGGRVHWLTPEGLQFPPMVARYIHKVATHLHNYEGQLPEDFIRPLVQFVKDTKSHVATLNYDKLLYTPFIDNDVFSALYRDTFLVDGMLDQGFQTQHLARQFGNDFGYYLHLHGSPLFIDNGDVIQKLPRDQLTLNTDRVGRHIVLTHVKHKPEIIASSYVLSA